MQQHALPYSAGVVKLVPADGSADVETSDSSGGKVQQRTQSMYSWLDSQTAKPQASTTPNRTAVLGNKNQSKCKAN